MGKPNEAYFDLDLQQITIEGYVSCACCGATLGYRGRVAHNTYLFIYAYPARGFRNNLDQRRVNARIQTGDVYCSNCGVWQAFNNS